MLRADDHAPSRLFCGATRALAPPPPLSPAATDVRFAPARDAVVAVLKEALASLGNGGLHTMQIRSVPHGKRD